MTTLHRCRTPTNWLCPCGRVERALQRHGIEHETVRHAPRAREDVEALTGQPKLPVLEIGRDVIYDSRRIIEHLRWREQRQS